MANPPVPTMSRDLRGETFGGQYWNPAEYQLTATAGDGTVVIALLDSCGEALRTATLDQAAQQSLIRLLEKVPDREDVPELGATIDICWYWGNEDRDVATLDVDVLAELLAWMRYAAREQEWDYAANGDTWEY